MNLIYQIFKRLSGLFKTDESKTGAETSSEFIGEVIFRLDAQYNMDFMCLLPETKNLDPDMLIEIAEKYAELLLYINRGLFTSQIIDILKARQLDKSEDTSINERLFIENTITFAELLSVEYDKVKDNRGPLIRPIFAFREHSM